MSCVFLKEMIRGWEDVGVLVTPRLFTVLIFLRKMMRIWEDVSTLEPAQTLYNTTTTTMMRTQKDLSASTSSHTNRILDITCTAAA